MSGKLKFVQRTLAAAVTVFGLALHGSVMAAPVSLTLSQPQLVDGENFSFGFGPLPGSDGTGGQLTFRIRGDFTIDASLGESYSFDLDGLFAVANLQATEANLITSFDFNDNLFEQSFAVGAGAMSAIAADGLATLLVDYASGVDVLAEPSIQVTLSYQSVASAVPEPGSLALVGVALAAATRLRRRRS
jgi:hypothetical protein